MSTKPRMKSQRAAANRYRALRDGQLSPARDAVLLLTAKLLVHGENLSARLFHLGELRADDEPRAALKELRELSGLVLSNLKYVYPADGAEQDGDPFGRFRQ